MNERGLSGVRHKGLLGKIMETLAARRSRLPAIEGRCAQLFPPSTGRGEANKRSRGMVQTCACWKGKTRSQAADELRECAAEKRTSSCIYRRLRNEHGVSSGSVEVCGIANLSRNNTNLLFDCSSRGNEVEARTRQNIEHSMFTKGVRDAMKEFFRSIRRDFAEAQRLTTEIHDMMQAMYTRFSTEQGIDRFEPPPFTMLKYGKEIDRIEHAYNEHFNTAWNMLSKAKFSLTQRFRDGDLARQARLRIANRDIESGTGRDVPALETRMSERHLQLNADWKASSDQLANGEIGEHLAEFDRQHEALAAPHTADARSRGEIPRSGPSAGRLPAAVNA